jgi:hypothetical protein
MGSGTEEASQETWLRYFRVKLGKLISNIRKNSVMLSESRVHLGFVSTKCIFLVSLLKTEHLCRRTVS